MQRIIYISTARAPMSNADLDGLLLTARRNNAAAGVTGMLVVGGQRFLQTLEGPDAAVDTIFARIKDDTRHHAVVTLSKKVIKRPAFGNWAMGYRAGGAPGTSNSLVEVVGALLQPIEDPTIRAYFEGFAELHAAA
ncbi:BLUF domain-containing protein [Sphingomonas sp.]|jgi:hypothetical protein|uniref:BLUF domain-containing protein n=1 Tax=Sphingomonas sp. TaxID=28214 RepID=UPI002E34B919|nr:BLUF domain-containing protein [Sphingomonas sp.]HEX4693901.1 BLUF domain-containing protein [Sphingomonas sp.]